MLNKNRKPDSFDYDLLIIGSGAAGGVGAHLASGYGKKVAIVESDKIGGDCPNYSCIPTKALLTAAQAIQNAHSSGQYGVRTSNIGLNLASLDRWKQSVIRASNGENSKQAFASEGITVIKGYCHFISQWAVSVGTRRITARKFLIATGSQPVIPKIPGLDTAGYITYKDIPTLHTLPKAITIIGGGATAYEYAQIFSAFGARVHVIEQHSHLLYKEDSEVGDLAEATLGSMGVRVHTHAKATQITGSGKHKVVTYEQQGQLHKIACDTIMVTSGKQPNIDLGLSNAGIRFDENGIRVNSRQQTNKKHIFAAGDVTGGALFTHAAVAESRIALHNMYKPRKISNTGLLIPRVFYGMPEIAGVGYNEHQLVMSGHSFQTAIAPIGVLGRASTSNFNTGFVKIIASHNGVIIGASIVAPHAGEMIQMLTLAIEKRQKACVLAETIYPFPSWSEAIRIAASRIKCI